MALVVFLRGVNVGGHRTFRPSVFAKELHDFDVVNVGAAGTFVVRKPGSITKFRAALLAKLPFETEVMICDGKEIIRWETRDPFGNAAPMPDTVRFVSVLSKARRLPVPITLPAEGEWFLRVVAARGRYLFGAYRRHMKTIGYLGQLDKVFGAPATTRNWNTVTAITKILREAEKKPAPRSVRGGRGSR
jgi:uncharacterized protein (DUF1697 family)